MEPTTNPGSLDVYGSYAYFAMIAWSPVQDEAKQNPMMEQGGGRKSKHQLRSILQLIATGRERSSFLQGD